MFPSTPILLANGKLYSFTIYVADPDGEITKKPGLLRVSGLNPKLDRNYTNFDVVDEGGLKKVTIGYNNKVLGDIPVGGAKLERITGDVVMPDNPNGDGGPGGNGGFPDYDPNSSKSAGMSETTVVIIGAVLFAVVGYLIWRKANRKS